METLLYNLGQALGMAILHSLWQGLLIYLLLRCLLGALPGIGSSGRYNLSVAAMLGIGVWFMVTLISELYEQDWNTYTAVIPQAYPFSLKTLGTSAIKAYESYSISLRPQLPFISMLYACGLLLQGTRLYYGRQQLRALKKTLLPDAALHAQIQRLAQRLKISKPVQAGMSHLATVPCVAGYLKPVIFMPAAMFTCLSPQEIEAILVHELAHIRRHDHLINYLQQLQAAVLFFNPFNILIDRMIDTEREHCCDDMVVNVTGQPLHYAYALLKIQEAQPQQNALALAAGGKNHLLNRIERIMKTTTPAGNVRHLALSLVLLTGSVCSIAWFNPEFKDGKLLVKHVDVPAVLHTFIDTVPKAPKPPKPAKPVAPVKAMMPVVPPVAAKSIAEDPNMDSLAAEVRKYSDRVTKFYLSPKFASIRKELEQTTVQIATRMKDPEMQALIAQQMQHASRITSSPEFNELVTEASQKALELTKYMGDTTSKDYRKTSIELQAISKKLESLGKGFEVSANGERTRTLDKSLDSLNAKIAARQKELNIAPLQAKMKRIQAQMEQYANSPEIKKDQKKLQEAAAKLYQRSSKLGYNNANEIRKQIDIKERPEQPELKEKIEIREKPELKEKIEIKEKSEKPELKEIQIKEKTEKP
ncbi:M48 family metalloprotease [Mucilaginibacter daejeonensis]|uniref:M56 family metallopeptidase n=1 Tax=Mucilaginibacter daejeonensis TaxID=398049 RepID=UPI001D176EEA|nr:M56 family metallopeptidase [Mucilaginibacter daejeonensis]UEG53137.1 M48 family metalloprotease [Mucilaginibacter daejeonensis]